MRCTKCNKHTAKGAFATYRNPRGELCRRGICKECRGKYAKENFERLAEWRKNYNSENKSEKRQKDAKRRMLIKSLIDKIKTEASCADCRGKFPAVAMDFDHTAGKNKSIARMVSGAYQLELIMEEIALCEIVCACCHRIRTSKRKQNHAPKKSENNTCI